MRLKKIIGGTAVVTILVALAVLYYRTDPGEGLFFPKCPFRLATGYDCPGCGSQRAVHRLLHGDLAGAWHANPLLLVLLPYVLAGIGFEYFGGKRRFPRLHRALYGRYMALGLLAVLVLYTVLRNLPGNAF